MPTALDSSQRKALRGMAHDLKPLVQVGKAGLADSVIEEIDHALEHHELIKVRFVDQKDRKRELSRTIAERLHCDLVGTIGHVAILYRRARDPDHRRLDIPAPRR